MDAAQGLFKGYVEEATQGLLLSYVNATQRILGSYVECAPGTTCVLHEAQPKDHVCAT